jgi:hypothetical protein
MALVAVALAALAIPVLYPVSLEARRIALVEVAAAVEIFPSAMGLWTRMRLQKILVEHFLLHGQYITLFLSQVVAAAVEISASAMVRWTHMRLQKILAEHFLLHAQYITLFLSHVVAAAQYKMRVPLQALATAQSSMRKEVVARMDVAASQILCSARDFSRMAKGIR